MNKGKRTDFGVEIARILPALMREVTKKQHSFLAESDLPVPGLLVLDLLRERGAATMGQISHVLHLSMSSATGIIDRMIDLGYVERDRSEEDRRVVNVILSDKGKKSANQVDDERRDMINNLYSVLTDKERAEYLHLLQKVYDSIIEEK